MSGFSRVFQPENDRKIIRNLILTDKDYQKIESRQLSAIKRTNLVDLKSKINEFNARWNYKGMAAMWNPQFIAELLAIKKAESEQTAGQKIFLQVWLHPILLSVRTSLYCPVLGYKVSDMNVMKNAIIKLDSNIDIITDQNDKVGLATVLDGFFIPDETMLAKVSDSAEIAVQQRDAESSILNGTAPMVIPDPITPKQAPPAEPKEEFKPTYFGFHPPKSLPAIQPKPEVEPKQENKNDDDDDDDDEEKDGKSDDTLAEKASGEYYCNYIISLPFHFDLNMTNDKCNVHVTENHRHNPESNLVTKSEQSLYFVGLPQSQRILHIQHTERNNFRLIINNYLVHLRVFESSNQEEFDSDLDEDYLNRINLTYTPPPSTPPSGVLSEINISANAPKLNRSGQSLVDVTDRIPFSLDDETSSASNPTDSSLTSNDSGIILRQFKKTWKASTPCGKIKGGRGQYKPN